MKNNIVSVIKGKATSYPKAPFNPKEVFPEFRKNIKSFREIDISNDVYTTVRESIYFLGLDSESYGSENWNPFKTLVRKEQKVVIKPNLVKANHPLGIEGSLCTISHASIIRPIIDYILLATEDDVEIVIADVPLQSSDWELLIERSGLQDLVKFYASNGINIDLLDLRYEISRKNNDGIVIGRDRKVRDPLGYTAVNLGEESDLTGIIEHYKKLEITDYSIGVVSKHHNHEVNEYYIGNTILNADLFINVPKLKTHRKAGFTFAMKNLIGINGDKSWLAHHRRGNKGNGGDEYDEDNFSFYYWIRWHLFKFFKRSKVGILFANLIKRFYTKVVWNGKTQEEDKLLGKPRPPMEGSWYGNDTLWRCIKDLNKIILYADKNGCMQKNQQRKYLCIGDVIVAGEKEGPMENLPKEVGYIIAGFNPVAIDYTAAHLMGFDWQKIPQIKKSFEKGEFRIVDFKPEDIKVETNIKNYEGMNLNFEPTINWKGHIERK